MDSSYIAKALKALWIQLFIWSVPASYSRYYKEQCRCRCNLLHACFIHVCSPCNLSWYAQPRLISNNNGCYSKFASKDSSWKSQSMVYISSKEGFQNNMEVTLNMLHESWEKITTCNHLLCLKARMTTLALLIYISENGKSLGRSSALGRKHTKEVTQKQHVLHKMEIKRKEITDQWNYLLLVEFH